MLIFSNIIIGMMNVIVVYSMFENLLLIENWVSKEIIKSIMYCFLCDKLYVRLIKIVNWESKNFIYLVYFGVMLV